MDISEYEMRIAELERENRILKQKLARAEDNRAILEEALETHSNALKVRNSELERSRELIRESETRYRNLAHHDILTGLKNRIFLYEQMERVLAEGRRKTAGGALIYADLDDFKPINDRFGHEAGDTVLKETAKRLLSCVRKDDIVARIGGDEFAILIPGISDHSELALIAEKIISVMKRSIVIKGRYYKTGVSIGISVYPADGDDPEKLLQKSDLAMYNVKKSRSSGYCFYSDIA
ncbi:MAG: diguanylate cyclase domain-containing protein [Burkholderiales bacterium]